MDHTAKKPLLKKILLIILILCVIGVAALLGINFYVRGSVSKYILSPDEASQLNADCIIVMGAGVSDGVPSPMLEDRLLEGIALWESGASQKILMSGDHGSQDYDEVNVMKQFAIDRGVPSSDVFMDHAGFSTYETMYRARDVFSAKKVVIVTQQYHLYRAIYVARQLGLEAYGVASDPREYAGQPIREAREILARVKDFVMCIFEPKPTYLGEVIPVFGDGDLTNDT